MSPTSLETRLTKNPTSVIDRLVDDEMLLIQTNSGNFFSLNAVGTRVWEALEDAVTVEDLVSLITAEYDVDEDRAQSDIMRLLDQLIEERLVVPA